MSHDHDHHDHDHGQEAPSDPALRVKALETALKERGLVDEAAVDRVIEYLEKSVGPHNGAKIIAKAWTDPAYKARDCSPTQRLRPQNSATRADRANT